MRNVELKVRKGVPVGITLDVDGDLSGKTVRFQVRERHGTAHLVNEAMEVGTAATVGGLTTTPLALREPANWLEALTPGVAYRYRVIPDNEPEVLYGPLIVYPEWG